MLAATLLLSFATLVLQGEPLARSPIPQRDLEKLAPDVREYFAAMDVESTDRNALSRKQKAIDSLQKGLDAAAKRAKVDEPLKYLADWDIVMEAAKSEDKALKALLGKGFARYDFADPLNGLHIACLLSMPASYAKAESPLPAIVVLKPGLALAGAELDAKVAEMARAACGPLVDTHMILVPLGPVMKEGRNEVSTEIEGSWMAESGQRTFFTALRVLLERVKFDRSRLVIDGWGDAGLDAMRMAASTPSWFAGAINRSGEVGGPEVLYGNLTGIPVLYVHGKGDGREVDPAALTGRQDLRSAVTVLDEAGSALAPSADSWPGITEWLAGCRKDLAPAAIHYKFGNLAYQSVHWLKAFESLVRAGAKPEDRDFPSIEARIDRAANRITIETVNIPSLFIYLNDALVDLDKEVVIEVNGAQRYTGKVKRSLPFLLENRYMNDSADYGLYVGELLVSEIAPNVPGKDS